MLNTCAAGGPFGGEVFYGARRRPGKMEARS
jgi:hypothetical protein